MMKGHTMKFHSMLSVIAASAALLATPAFAEDGANSPALLKALPTAHLSLQKGLEASSSNGKPISGKFEMEDGKLQLSVYTAKAGKFAEVIVDYNSGKVLKVEPITQGDDLAHAKAQAEALGKTRKSLKAIADKVERDAPGSRIVSILPGVSDNKAVADVALAKGDEIQSVVAPLQ
jgi:hypothetical protein